MRERHESAFSHRMVADLERWQDQSQLRDLELLPGVSFCSNDYLGLATSPELRQAVLDAVRKAPAMGSSGSRLLSGNTREWEELESDFAEFAGTESALYFGSGYAANLGLLSSILKPGDLVFSDEFNHASLIDGMRLSGATKIVYPHLDLLFLDKALAENRGTGTKLIVTESLFSMEGDIAPLDKLLGLARQHGAQLVIDEAHATGVRGPQGRGIAAGYQVEHDALAIVHTCGKALASVGAFVCGPGPLRSFLLNRARTFIFSTAMPPYVAGQIRAALGFARHAEAERGQLNRLATALREGLSRHGLCFGSSASHLVPVFFLSNERALYVEEQLRTHGYAAKAIRPPTVPAGTARIRLSLTCKITLEEIEGLISTMETAVRSAPRLAGPSTVHA